MNQVSIYHDYIAATFEVTGRGNFVQEFASLFGSKATMLPAFGYTYGRLIDQSLPYWPQP